MLGSLSSRTNHALRVWRKTIDEFHGQSTKKTKGPSYPIIFAECTDDGKTQLRAPLQKQVLLK
jgi:hypothetical protein